MPTTLADTGPTPADAARTRAIRYVARAAQIIGDRTYSVAPCILLHRRPWVAYTCRYFIAAGKGRGEIACRDTLVLAVKRLPNGLYGAQAKKVIGTSGSC